MRHSTMPTLSVYVAEPCAARRCHQIAIGVKASYLKKFLFEFLEKLCLNLVCFINE
jgi:hypothetical protein